VGTYTFLPQQTSATEQRSRGKELFWDGSNQFGTMNARLAHQPDLLPVLAIKCANCHTQVGTGELNQSRTLSKERLLSHIPRRGAPASRFDQTTFCKLLGTGIDPAWVIIDQAMPRYELSDAQCADLWLYLTSSDE